MRVYTVGHSTRSLEELVSILRSHGIRLLVDVRRFPASRRHPHFARESLERALPHRCHRRLIADRLTAQGHEVVHLLDEKRTQRHELPDFARVEDGRVVYDGGQMELPVE